ncbi:Shedu anti-phage system protein SduA domain-containing protein [Spirosoma sp. KUDC1026]|uniref:Shedu anti-phage system protein SduA domain-containing protein n=1 Tax=Spirosoma sp. KUDC1026 TaxID=2745947 RepID=UPI00159BB8C3|nr:Shedu anti-phage system protein SduA domain-containing protein [Spirosoma sp. KUDC1026]QKZ12142.1 DUF4263 domain-containing protein [Spirosoma sp. KUDC1026]
MEKEEILATWDLEKSCNDLNVAFDENSELKLLATLKNNSFMFYELYSRKYGIQPVFHEVNFGGGLRCDFAWLNDNSDGPEWVLVEIEKPNIELFTRDYEPTQKLNHAFEQVKSWRRYFDENPAEKRRIFGAVGRFRFIIVAGHTDIWNSDKASKWRIDNNKETGIEIRSSNIFYRALKILEDHPEELWSFAENPTTLSPSTLQDYWSNYDYMNKWRRLIN